MKKSILTTFAAGLALSAAAQAVTDAPSGYSLRWADEFNGSALNEKIWNIEVNGGGGGNQELQYYRRENVSVGTDPKSGEQSLVLTLRRENFAGKSFTSGRITSQDKAYFKHGLIQARIKFPKTKNGIWPAYWMMGNDLSKYGWPRCGEMDIVELGNFNGYNGRQETYFGGTLHYGPNATNQGHQYITQEYNHSSSVTDDEYHIFTVEWDDQNIYMYIDLQGYTAAKKRQARYFTLEIPYGEDDYQVGKYFHKPFFFLFNLAVGGTFTNIYDPGQITAIPNYGDEAKMYVDWVRVYQKDGDQSSLYSYINEKGEVVSNIGAEPEPEVGPDDRTELSSFATKALDDNGETTFDFDDVSDAVLISTSDGVRGHLYTAGANVIDYNVNNDNRNLYPWENTYVPVDCTGKINSFGWAEGYNKFTVASVGWSGLGFNIVNEDLSMIDDTYWLHFAMRGADPQVHTSHEVQVAKAKFRVGVSDGTLASIGDFKRDGEWYYFDIPMKALSQFANPVLGSNPANFNDNIISFLSGGLTDAELCFDNIFFYKSKTKEVPVYKDTTADLGKYGYKSLDAEGNPVFSFDGITDIVPLYLSGDTWESLTAGGTYSEGSLIKEETDNSEQGGRNNFFIWGDPQTMVNKDVNNVANSMGRIPYGGFQAWTAAEGATWTGAGWAAIAGQGMTPKPLNLSTIDDSYYLHVSLRSEDAVGHVPVMLRIGADDNDAVIIFGSYATKPIFADFNRDGEWYSFDIPVAELKRYGTLWSKASNLASFTDYSLCIYTDKTLYSNTWFSIDNVFFWTKGEAPDINPLGDYTTKSLNDAGESYFDFADKDYIYLSVCGQVVETISGINSDKDKSEYLIGDYRNGINGVNFYNWGDGNTYTAIEDLSGITNSFGGDEGWIAFRTNGGWTGAGLNAGDLGCDFSELVNGEWYLHFAMRGTDNCAHQIGFGESKFTIGPKPFTGGVPVLGDYKRDGEWYSYDIPVSKLGALSSIFPANQGGIGSYKGNILSMMSGGGVGDELHLDNIFLWRDHYTSGIDDITDTETVEEVVEAVYDLMGNRVKEPGHGIYIVRTNLRAYKVAL